MEFYNSSDCWIGLSNLNAVYTKDNIQYFQWIDSTINSFNYIENEQNENGCVSISQSGEWIVNNCEEALYNCFICNSIDSPTITVSNHS